jgi:hypothetical protein
MNLSIVALLFVTTLTCAGQAVRAEPDISDVFYRLANDALVPLERQQGSAIKGGSQGFVVLSMKTSREFRGAKSVVRFQAGQGLTLFGRISRLAWLTRTRFIPCEG